ncbi:MAG: hypothetical protein WAU88_15110 [Candidatus Zixiibacteriota bacterium]
MRILIVTLFAASLLSCSLAPKIQPVTIGELVGTYVMDQQSGTVDRLTLNADSSYFRYYDTGHSRTFEDHGKWYLHLLGSRQNSPYVKLQLDHFVTHFVEDTIAINSPLDPVPGGVADSVECPREARIWKRIEGNKVTIRLGNLQGTAWVREYSK